MNITINNRYQLDTTKVLGRGGMGTVYLAEDIATATSVAVKELIPEIVVDHPDQVERFTREADALARLNHPNIVKVLASIQEDDRHYIVMEYVDGGSLQGLLNHQPQQPLDRVLQIALDLADALTRAHRLKIIHRDIKPANVLLAADGTPRLTDFGVARIEDRSNVTKTGTVVGTLNYLSPEALNGAPPDERTDIWAFGVMLYEMIAGRRPFEADTTGSLITSIMTKPAPDLRELRPETPLALVMLIDQMIQKDPESRISSVRKVGLEIENIIRGVDSDELIIDDTIKQTILEADGSRFETATPQTPFDIKSQVVASTPQLMNTAQPANNTSNTIETPAHTGVTWMQDADGSMYMVVPRRLAFTTQRMFFISTALAILFGIAVIGMVFGADILDDDPLGEALDDIEIEVVNDDELMVIVANVNNPIADQQGAGLSESISELIVVNLRETLERDIPFSNIRIREFDYALSNAQEARRVAEYYDAAAIIWGVVTGQNAVGLSIQSGDLEQFTTNSFDAETISRTADIEALVTFDSQTRPSLEPLLLGVLGSLHAANGDVFELMRVLAILAEIELEATPEVISTGINEHITVFFANYLTDTEVALEAMNTAITRDGGNALLYAYRGLAHARMGDYEAANRDVTTATRIGPENWATPLMLSSVTSDDMMGIITTLEEAATYRPDDWFIQSVLGEINYVVGNFSEARTAIERSISLQPEASYPYVSGYLLAMRDGRVTDGSDYIRTIAREYPDPYFGNRILEATFDDNRVTGGQAYSATTNLIIGQYEATLEQTSIIRNIEEAVASEGGFVETVDMLQEELDTVHFLADVTLIRGLAFCNLGQNQEALRSYTIGLRLAPDFNLLQLARADVLNKQGNHEAAQADVEAARGLSDEFDMVVESAISGELTCENFFDYFLDFEAQTSVAEGA